MSEERLQVGNRPRLHWARAVLLEGSLVGIAGLLFGLAANHLSPRGLALTRDYFPGSTQPPPNGTVATGLLTNPATTNTTAPSAAELAAARLKAKGLQLVSSNEVVRLFRDPRYQMELAVFVDARDDQHYQGGHIPGAYQFDHYRADRYFATVFPVCQTAEQIVIYCNGGGCEDSEFAALTLRDAGVMQEKLFVYGGGMAEWTTNGLPVELGGRNSGNIRTVSPP